VAVLEAPLRATRFGPVPDGEGWFVINAGAAALRCPYHPGWLPQL